MKRKPPSIHRYFLGYLFLFLGLLFGFLPFLQGWIFVMIGLVLLKDDRWARKAHIYIRRRYPQSRPAFRWVYERVDKWLEKWWKI